ncbi:MAG: methyltransferase [Candidatus Acidiferrum sp.]
MNRSALFFILAPLIGIPYLVYLYAHSPWPPLRIAGLVIMLLGLLLITVARFQLGNSFSITPQARQLVTHGLYSRIRNPVYVFGSVVIIGLFLFLNKPYYFLAFLVIIPLQIVRARAESRVLEARFGDQYLQYKSQTWF